jgi:hypothetical protein
MNYADETESDRERRDRRVEELVCSENDWKLANIIVDLEEGLRQERIDHLKTKLELEKAEDQHNRAQNRVLELNDESAKLQEEILAEELSPEMNSRCASCSQHERITRLKAELVALTNTVRRQKGEIYLLRSKMDEDEAPERIHELDDAVARYHEFVVPEKSKNDPIQNNKEQSVRIHNLEAENEELRKKLGLISGERDEYLYRLEKIEAVLYKFREV